MVVVMVAMEAVEVIVIFRALLKFSDFHKIFSVVMPAAVVILVVFVIEKDGRAAVDVNEVVAVSVAAPVAAAMSAAIVAVLKAIAVAVVPAIVIRGILEHREPVIVIVIVIMIIAH